MEVTLTEIKVVTKCKSTLKKNLNKLRFTLGYVVFDINISLTSKWRTDEEK